MQEGVAGVSYFAKSKYDHRISRSWGWTCFGFGLAQSGTTTIRKCFWVLLFYFSTYYDTFTAGLVASANILFVGFGFSVILSLPKTRARLRSYQHVGIDTTVRGRVGVPLGSKHFIPLHSNKALDFHLFTKNKHNHSSRLIEKVHTSISIYIYI